MLPSWLLSYRRNANETVNEGDDDLRESCWVVVSVETQKQTKKTTWKMAVSVVVSNWCNLEKKKNNRKYLLLVVVDDCCCWCSAQETMK
jgi:hypothetical protein